MKAKTLAISAMCAAGVFGCLALAALPGTKWVVFILGVVASIAAVIPLMLDVKNLVYTLLTYLVGSVLGVFLGIANVVYVAPIVTFCIPFAIVKVYGESKKVTAAVESQQTLEDPFGNGDDKKVVEVRVQSKPMLPTVVRWILYYVLLEAGIGLTLLSAWLFMRPVFETLVASKLFWACMAVTQLAVFPYNMLMQGCLIGMAKILRKATKPQ